MRRSIAIMNRRYVKRYATTLVMLAAFFAALQPVLPECGMEANRLTTDSLASGMMADADCTMSDEDSNTNPNDCSDCPVAFCFSSASFAQISGSASSLGGEFKLVSQAMASDTVLAGRILTPPGHPPKV